MKFQVLAFGLVTLLSASVADEIHLINCALGAGERSSVIAVRIHFIPSSFLSPFSCPSLLIFSFPLKKKRKKIEGLLFPGVKLMTAISNFFEIVLLRHPRWQRTTG
jgi:hypothetical protein